MDVPDGSRHEAPFGGNHRHRERLTDDVVGQVDLVDAGIGSVQEAEPVFASLDFMKRLDYAVHHHGVAQEPVPIERIEDQRAAGVENLVLQDER